MLSIIIVTYNAKKYLLSCIESVIKDLEKNNIKFEVIVIDNASNDKSKEDVLKLFPQVTYFFNNENQGFSKAFNKGVLNSKGDYILRLDSDTIIYPGSIFAMYKSIKDNPNIGIVVPMLLNDDETIQLSLCRSYPNIQNMLIYSTGIGYFLEKINPNLNFWGKQTLPISQYYQSRRVAFAPGACYFIKREVFDKIGLLDENYFVQFEDTDFCLRAMKCGFHIWYESQARVKHYGGKSSGNIRNQIKNSTKSKIYFFKKHRGTLYLISYSIIQISITFGILPFQYLLHVFTKIFGKPLSGLRKLMLTNIYTSYYIINELKHNK